MFNVFACYSHNFEPPSNVIDESTSKLDKSLHIRLHGSIQDIFLLTDPTKNNLSFII